MNISLSFAKDSIFWVYPICFIGWLLVQIMAYRTVPGNVIYRNFLYYLYANNDNPLANVINTTISLIMISWIIRLIYTIIYGFQPC